MPQPLVLFTDVTDLSIDTAQQHLAAHGIDSAVMSVDNTGIIDASQLTAIGLIVGYRDITAELMKQLPNLQFIGTTSNGTDMVDADYAEANEIWLTNVGHAATEEVAVHTMTLILSAVRHIRDSIAATSSGGWTKEVQSVPHRVSEMTLGIVGYGKIGRKVASLAAPFFGDIVAYDPVLEWTGEAARQVDFDELLRSSGVVSLHVPLLPSTRGLLGAEQLAMLQPGSVLVNVSRGELIDEGALTAALDAGNVGTACLDVLDREPPESDHPLRRHHRVLLTPHIAFLSDASLREYEESAARNIAAWWSGNSPSDFVVRGRSPRR